MVSEGGGAAEGRVDGGGELVGVHAGRRRVLWRGVDELAKARREKKEGVLLVLMRAKGEGGGL